jgi:hypothetical protein
MGRYMAALVAVQAIVAGIGVALVLLWDVDLGSGTGTAAIIGSALAVASMFVKDMRRSPTPAERSRLTWWSLAATYAFSLVAVGIFIAVTAMLGYGDDLREIGKALANLPLFMWFIIIAVTVGINWCLFYFTYRFYPGVLERAQAKRS